MKSTGIVRKIDELGRVVIPMEIRRNLEIKEGDPIEFFIDGDLIILQKYQSGCHACGNVDRELLTAGKVKLCDYCVSQMVAE